MDHSNRIDNSPGIAGTVVKKNHKDLGITFQDHPSENVVYIYKLKGKFKKHTMLAPGLRVTHVNGFIVFKAIEAIKLIQKTPIGGSVQVIASGRLIELKKPSRFLLRSSTSSSASSTSAPLGIHLRPLPGRLGLVQITKVDNLLTDIPVGHLLVSVNKRPVASVKKAHWHLRMCSQRVNLVTCPVQSFSCISPKSKGVVEPIELTDHDSVNAFHPNLMADQDEEDPFFAPLSSNWKPTLEEQLSQLKIQSEKQQDENDTVLNQYESDANLCQYRIRRRQDSSSTMQSYPSSRHDKEEEDVIQKKNAILDSLPKDENGSYILEDDEDPAPTMPLIRLPSSFNIKKEQSMRSTASSSNFPDYSTMASSEAPSGLPDMIMNLQMQNDFLEEAMGSFRSGQGGGDHKIVPQDNQSQDNDDIAPFIFVDSNSDSEDEHDESSHVIEEEDLLDVLEGHLPQEAKSAKVEATTTPDRTKLVPGVTKTTIQPILPLAKSANKQQSTTTPLRDKTNNNRPSPTYSPSFFDRKAFFEKKASPLFQSVEKAKRSGENKSPGRETSNKPLNHLRKEVPALLDTASSGIPPKERRRQRQRPQQENRTTTTTQKDVCLPVQIHVTSMDAEDLQSFLTEEETKADYVMELIQPKSGGLATPFRVQHQQSQKYQKKASAWCMPLEDVKEETSVEEMKLDLDDGDDESYENVVEEIDEGLLAKTLHFLQAIAAEATTCVSPSRKYYRHSRRIPHHQQYEVYAV